VGADVGFVRVEPGVRFPYHIHKGKETALILQGGVREDDDTIYQTGDLYVATVDAHSFTALPGEPLIYAVVVWGVEFPEA
jgi:anti-sigma factor ChrR (cupin superfamily)